MTSPTALQVRQLFSGAAQCPDCDLDRFICPACWQAGYQGNTPCICHSRQERIAPMFSEAPITIVREDPNGHHTVRASSPAEALAQLAELEQGLAQLGQAPAEPAPQPIRQVKASTRPEPQAPGPTDPACPAHGAGYLAPSKWGGVYCTARPAGGAYCKWSSAKAEKTAAKNGAAV